MVYSVQSFLLEYDIKWNGAAGAVFRNIVIGYLTILFSSSVISRGYWHAEVWTVARSCAV